jgi:phage gp46-like protein
MTAITSAYRVKNMTLLATRLNRNPLQLHLHIAKADGNHHFKTFFIAAGWK